jgi:uncharacterized protein
MPVSPSVPERIARELNVQPHRVAAAVALLDEGATVPFLARYRKEATGGLDDTQLRALQERLDYLRELEARRSAILASVEERGQLTPALRAQIEEADTKQRLEDLYLPYRPRRRTKAQIAREAGLEPLAEALLADPALDPQQEAAQYVKPAFSAAEGENPGVPDVKAALDGARHILAERFAEDAELIGRLREHLQAHARLTSEVIEGKAEAGAKFRDYFAYAEPLQDVPSHRTLALLRGRSAQVLRLALKLPEELAPGEQPPATSVEKIIAARFGVVDQGRAADAWLAECVRWAWRARIAAQLETDLLASLRERAEREAIRVFARNLHDLLLAAPAGARVCIGLDPGLRTGVKVAVVDRTGKLLDTATVHPHAPANDWDGAIAALAELARKHSAELVSIGNGTASRETDRLAADLIKRHPELGLAKVVVSEAGASVYSASKLAAREFPDLDVSLRGAVSIARRLQDPLAELVKIEPRAIGVGQYQHDVNQAKLARSLDAVVEDCVNAVGVDVNTASASLLARISGLSAPLAENIVHWRDEHGAYREREALKRVPRMGQKTFEQAAGFLRIMDGDNPLDASAVHPEAYPVVERILADIAQRALAEESLGVKALIGNSALLTRLEPERYTDARFGLPTVQDILRELDQPGRDPRPVFRTAAFKEGVEELKDLQSGMVLEGVVTNVTNFGAFVDVGVHQDGLVHISALSNKFVRDPREVVKAGDVVKVKVLEVDEKRRRIALSMRLEERKPAPKPAARPAKPAGPPDTGTQPHAGKPPGADKPPGARKPPGSGEAPHSGKSRGSRKPPDSSKSRSRGAPAGRPATSGPPVGGAMAEALARALSRKRD